MSEIIVPVLMFSGELEFVSMWSIKEWDSPWILVDLVFKGTKPLPSMVLK
jgi:hypothetical protein